MANSILPNSSYLLKFSTDQLNDHRELFVIGAVLTEWFDHIGNAHEDLLTAHSMVSALKQFSAWLEEGQRLSQRWNRLAERLDSVYGAVLQLQ